MNALFYFVQVIVRWETVATGSYPFVPKVAGTEWQDCFVYRAIEDLEAIRVAAATAKVGTVTVRICATC